MLRCASRLTFPLFLDHCTIQVPVAKRNFRKRHKHGKSSSGNDGEDDDDIEDEEEVTKPVKKHVEKEPKKETPATFCQEIPKKMDVPTPVVSAKKVKAPKEAKEPRVVNNVIHDNPQETAPPLPVVSHQARPKISAERETLWAQLLAKRPPTKDGEAVSAWLMEVLSVSDLDTPLKENGQVSPNAAVSLPFKSASTGSTGSGAVAQVAAASKTWSKGNGDSKDPQSPGSRVVIKKKRPLPILHKDDEDDEGSDEPPAKEDDSSAKKDVGSFAEWKDRKKHKSLPKKGFAMQNE